jgi:hypothetical protein
MRHLPAGIPPRLRSGAVPSTDPTAPRSGPATRDAGEAAVLARNAVATWQDVMGDRREPEREDPEQPARRRSTAL